MLTGSLHSLKRIAEAKFLCKVITVTFSLILVWAFYDYNKKGFVYISCWAGTVTALTLATLHFPQP